MAVKFFRYNHISSQRFHIYCTSDTMYSAPERDVEHISIPGRDGDLIVDNGRWKNFNLPISCFFRSKAGDAELYSRKIKAWLLENPAQYLPLEFSDSCAYFRLAQFSGGLEIESGRKWHNQFGKFEVNFNCKPYLYLKSGQLIQDITLKSQLFNPEAFESLPYIKVTGTGDIRLTVGNTSWDFEGVNGWIENDSEVQNIFKGTASENSKKVGDGYPRLNPGENGFAWEGNVEKVEVIPRWRTI